MRWIEAICPLATSCNRYEVHSSTTFVFDSGYSGWDRAGVGLSAWEAREWSTYTADRALDVVLVFAHAFDMRPMSHRRQQDISPCAPLWSRTLSLNASGIWRDTLSFLCTEMWTPSASPVPNSDLCVNLRVEPMHTIAYPGCGYVERLWGECTKWPQNMLLHLPAVQLVLDVLKAIEPNCYSRYHISHRYEN